MAGSYPSEAQPQLSGQAPQALAEVSRALECASQGADLASLDFAIGQASQAGLPEAALGRALKRKAALESRELEVQRQRAYREAASALHAALGTTNADMLDSAICRAQEAGLDEAELEQARRHRAALEAESQRQRASTEALSEVWAARQCTEASRFSAALLRALKAGADRELLRQAALGVEPGEARAEAAARALHCALAGTNVQLLQLCTSWAEAEGGAGGPDLLAAARERQAVLAEVLAEDALRDRRLGEAAKALSLAWRQTDPEVFAEALAGAEYAGVSEEMLRVARRRWAELEGRARQEAERREAEAQRAVARQVAEEELVAVLGSSDAEVLAAAVARAEEADVDGEALERARASLAKMRDTARRQHDCSEAGKALKFAMIRGDAEALTTAIEQAVKAGVSREVVARARRKLQRVQGSGPSTA